MDKPIPRVLVVDDNVDMCSIFRRLLRRVGMHPMLANSGPAALEMVRDNKPDVMLLDLWMPGMDGREVLKRTKTLQSQLPVIMITAASDTPTVVEMMRMGAHDYLTKPVEHRKVVEAIHEALASKQTEPAQRWVGEAPSCEEGQDGTQQECCLHQSMGQSAQVGALLGDVKQVAPTDFSVLLIGETGVGKEVVARQIHAKSRRASAPFLAIDCGAISETLIENELFGHEKGAFTGADRALPGKFEQAAGGTLFLDEIANLPLSMQNNLLRVLQEKHFFRVGGTQAIAVDARIIAASNCELDPMVGADGFRLDLYHRLSEFVINVPSLRQRKEDIPFLTQRFMSLTNRELGKQVQTISEEAQNLLQQYHWPGNVRELRNVIRRAVLLADESIEKKHLRCLPNEQKSPALCVKDAAPKGQPPLEQELPLWTPEEHPALKEILHNQKRVVEKKVIMAVLNWTKGNVAAAARLLQTDYKTIHTKIKVYRILKYPESEQ